MRKTTNKILSALIAASMILGMVTTATVAAEPDTGSTDATVQETTVDAPAEEQEEPVSEETYVEEPAEEQQEEPAEQAESAEAEEPAQEEEYEEPAGEQEAVPADADDQEEAFAEAVEEQQETAVNMPAQSFKKSVEAADINNEMTTVTVIVNAPEGALPEKSGMTVGAVGANDVLTGTGRTVLETVKGTTEDEVIDLITLEIVYTDADGYEIDPKVPVDVTIITSKVGASAASADYFFLACIDEENEAEIIKEARIDQTAESVFFEQEESGLYVVTQRADRAFFEQQPEDQLVAVNGTAVFNAEINLPYSVCQWQYSKDGGSSWKDLNPKTYGSAKTLSFKVKSSYDGYQYRCVVTLTDNRKITSEPARLSIDWPAILKQPKSKAVALGDTASFEVTARGKIKSCRWQYFKKGGSSWKDLNPKTYGSAKTLSFKVKSSYDGYQYRCVVTFTDNRKITSKPARLSIDWPAILKQPKNTTVALGDTASFEVTAHGKIKSCQWQYFKKGGSSWKNLSVNTYGNTTSLSFRMKKSYDGYMYRCRVDFTDGSKLYSKGAVLNILPPLMPAVELNAGDGNAAVTIDAGEGALPEGTSLGIETVDTAEVGDVSGLVEKGTVLYAADISFEDINGDSVEPAKNVSVSLTVDGADWNENCRLVHINDDGSRELVGNAVFSGDRVTFSSDSFSVYAVVKSGSTEPEARITVNFFGKNTEEPIATFYVKNSDTPAEIEKIVYDPGVGELDQSARELFAGWSVSTLGGDDGKNYTITTEAKQIDEIRAYLADLEITEDDVLNIYGMIVKTYTVTYLDLDDTVLSTFSSQHLISETESDHTVNMPYTPSTSVQNFEGWRVIEGADHITSAVYEGQECQSPYKNGTKLTITGDVTLSVSAPYGHWLVFNENGKGATYNAPQFVKNGARTVEPALEMTRPGYIFEGWYTEDQYPDGEPFVFGQRLTDNITLKAKWTMVAEAPFSVIVWKQSVQDNYDVAEADKIYDFAFYEKPTEASNKPVSEIDLSRYTTLDGGSITVGDTEYSFYGFKYNSEKGPVATNEVILPNGTTVINIYYDREVVTYGFWIDPEEVGDWVLREIFTGLFGQRLDKYKYIWPTDYRWYISGAVEELAFASLMDTFVASLNSNPTAPFHTDWYGWDVGFNTEVRHYLQNLDESWPDSPTYTVPTKTGNAMSFRDFQGFTKDAYRVKLPNGVNTYYTGTAYTEDDPDNPVLVDPVSHTAVDGWTDWIEPDISIEYRNNGGSHSIGFVNATAGGIEFRYSRNKYTLSYMVGKFVSSNGEGQDLPIAGTLKTVPGIYYELPMANFAVDSADYYEPPHQDNYTFVGWFSDAACTKPADFSEMTMPINGVTVYGKWILNEYRVFLHPNVDPSDTTLEWGSETQKMCFRVSSGGKVSAPTGTRIGSGYEMVGWYADEACTKVFNGDAFILNDTSVTTPYNMATDFTDEMDKYGEGATYNNDDEAHENRYWITKRLDLYAKWRAITVGADGIGITYDANGGTAAPEDSTLYQDTAKAIAQGAATAPEGQQFVYWVLQAWDEDKGKYADTKTYVFPGDDFEVLLQDAKAVELPESTPEHPKFTYTIQLRAEYAPEEVPTPTHLTWYANYEGGGSSTDNNLQINKAVDIKSADTFTRDGYEFIGWARVPTTNDDGTAMDPAYELSPKDLTASDLFLIYDKKNNRFTTSDGTAVTQVAADEKYPYHDLYAVWKERAFFQVYHTGTAGGNIEKVYMDTLTDGKYNITQNLTSGTIYGGYYSAYHNGTNAYAGDQTSWNAAEAYTTAIKETDLNRNVGGGGYGDAMTPAAGMTYYVKEIPASYLQPSQFETYHYFTKVEKNFYLVTTIDDANYNEVGFILPGAADNAASVYNTLTVKYDSELDIDEVREETKNYKKALTVEDFSDNTSGYVCSLQYDSMLTAGTARNFRPYIKTFDGMKVTGTGMRRVIVSSSTVDEVTAVRKNDIRIYDYKNLKSTIAEIASRLTSQAVRLMVMNHKAIAMPDETESF